MTLEGGYNLWQVLPYLVVLVGALAGLNVFLVLIGGTVLSILAGLGTGTIVVADIFRVMGEGVTSMYDITVISIIVAAIVALVKEYGGIEYILNVIKKRISGSKGGEFGISLLVLLVDCCTANNTVAMLWQARSQKKSVKSSMFLQKEVLLFWIFSVQ